MNIKKIITILVLAFGLYVIGTVIYFSVSPVDTEYCPISDDQEISLTDDKYPNHMFKVINDASCLNKTRIYDIVRISSVDDVQQALSKAKDLNLSVSVAGVRHSMGGQAFAPDALVLDMRGFNKIISIDTDKKFIKVQSGATWHDIQKVLHEKSLAIKAMQSTDIFTVGGSLSVNAHGMDHHVGSLGATIRSFSIMLANGEVHLITRESNAELFNAVIGGYGLFGVILEIELEVTDNVLYKQQINIISTDKFVDFFNAHQADYELFYAHLSTSPYSFFEDMIMYGYKKIEYDGEIPPLQDIKLIKIRRFLLNLSKKRNYAQVIKWVAEKYIDPYLSQLHQQQSIVSRNQVMHDSVEYLQNVIWNETDILHEYFVPIDQFGGFIKQVSTILKNYKTIVLNASVRFVHQESNFLNYAPTNMVALVLYLNQQATPTAHAVMEVVTQKLINAALEHKGTFFLPYQLYFTDSQLRKAYPMIDQFFALKKKYDPDLLFRNMFYNKYAIITT